VSELSTRQAINLNGQLSYDLATLEPQLRDMLGKSVRAQGKDKRPFQLRGTLDQPALMLGEASLGWQSVSAYGFDMGASSLNAKLEDSTLTTNTIEATFGTTGKVRLKPTANLKPGQAALTFEKGRIIDHAALTPASCAEAIGFALPAIAKATQAEGLISLDIEENRMPFNDVNQTTAKGKLTLHNVTVVAGPVITEVAALFAEKQPRMQLAQEQVVPIRIEKGRVHHENMAFTMNGFKVTTSGSVGFDGSLSMIISVPLPESAVGPILKKAPKLRDALINKRVNVPITGTMARPMVDQRAFQASVGQLTDEALREAAKGKVDDLLQEGLKKLIPKK
jgi:translocation and assembly module TamB